MVRHQLKLVLVGSIPTPNFLLLLKKFAGGQALFLG